MFSTETGLSHPLRFARFAAILGLGWGLASGLVACDWPWPLSRTFDGGLVRDSRVDGRRLDGSSDRRKPDLVVDLKRAEGALDRGQKPREAGADSGPVKDRGLDGAVVKDLVKDAKPDGKPDAKPDGKPDAKPSTCGNSKLDPGEPCDGTLLGGKTCAQVSPSGYSGTLGCKACVFDTSQCTCGNGSVETWETCDGAQLKGATCKSLGFDGGTLACNASCSAVVTSACTTCGDGKRAGTEACDGLDLGGQTCTSVGYKGGTLACTSGCALATAGCIALLTGGSTAPDNALALAMDSDGNSFITGDYASVATFGSFTLSNASGNQAVFVLKVSPTGTVQWASSSTSVSSGYGRGQGIAVDGQGNVYITGYYTGSLAFGSHTLTALGGADIFMAKLDKYGAFLWAESVGSSMTSTLEQGLAVAVDAAGVSTYTGFFSGTASFGSTTLTASGTSGDIFVARLAAQSGFLWATSAGSTNHDQARALGLTPSGGAVICGQIDGTAVFGSTTLTPSSSSPEMFVAGLSSTGVFTFAAQAQGSATDDCRALVVDGSGNVTVAGSFSQSLTLGSTTLTSSGSTDIVVARLTSTGGLVWATGLGGTSAESAAGLALDDKGNVLLGGQYSGSLTVGTSTLTSAGSNDLLLATISPTGNALTALSAGGPSSDQVNAVGRDAKAGAWAVVGRFNNTASFGSLSATAVGSSDIVLWRPGSLLP